ncbi:MAG: hypothetical protein J0L92_07125 [Deltaproteobacteria bacterium]|nr:hypothetical protein [Deltaproteobacteria bacterium]
MRQLFVLAFVLIALALLAPREVEAGACAGPGRAVIGVVPSETDVIPRGEAVLVQVMGGTLRQLGPPHRAELGEPLETPFGIRAHFERRGMRPISIRTEAIAPGLARFVPSRPPEAGTWQLVAQGQHVDVLFGDTPAPPLGLAPELVRVERRTVVSSGRPGSSGGRSATSFVATLRQPITQPWRGILTYGDPRAESDARISRPIAIDQASQMLHATAGRCGFSTPGESPPLLGHEVSVALYDLYGRVSTRSNVVRVVEAP